MQYFVGSWRRRCHVSSMRYGSRKRHTSRVFDGWPFSQCFNRSRNFVDIFLAEAGSRRFPFRQKVMNRLSRKILQRSALILCTTHISNGCRLLLRDLFSLWTVIPDWIICVMLVARCLCQIHQSLRWLRLWTFPKLQLRSATRATSSLLKSLKLLPFTPTDRNCRELSLVGNYSTPRNPTWWAKDRAMAPTVLVAWSSSGISDILFLGYS